MNIRNIAIVASAVVAGAAVAARAYNKHVAAKKAKKEKEDTAYQMPSVQEIQRVYTSAKKTLVRSVIFDKTSGAHASLEASEIAIRHLNQTSNIADVRAVSAAINIETMTSFIDAVDGNRIWVCDYEFSNSGYGVIEVVYHNADGTSETKATMVYTVS